MEISRIGGAVALSVALFVSAFAASAQPAAKTAPVAPYDPTRPAAVDAGPVVLPTGPALPAALTANAARTTDKKSFLWEVKSKTNVVYLFGTIHV
ncbi:MAG: hypothetical protein ABL931_19670, partial [Usitatibacteraceae bacterium]